MEKKIGEKFEFRGVMLEVVESKPDECYTCYGLGCDCHLLPDCCSSERIDEKSVRFVLAKKTFFDAYTDLIVEAERVAKLAETPEQHALCNETVDRLIASRNSLSPIQATLHVEDYGEYSRNDAPTMVSEE